MAPTGCKRMVSGSISLPCSGYFSPFLHSTGSLSVSWEYLALPGGPGRFRQDSSCPALLRILLIVNAITCTRLSLSADVTFQSLPVLCYLNTGAVLQPRYCRNNIGLGSFHFARRYFGNRCFFLFLLLLRCFSSEGWPTSRCVRSST